MAQLNRGIVDATFNDDAGLPNGAATTYSADFDTGTRSSDAAFPETVELKIEAPALATGVLGDAATVKYSVCAGSSASPTTVVLADVLTQTGAGGAGAAAASTIVRLPANVGRYVRVRAVKSASGDASGSNMTVSLRF